MSGPIKWVVWDAEANGLYPDKFYCLSFHDYEGNKGTVTDYEDIRNFFLTYDWYIGHNIRRWDLPNLERVVGITIPKNIIDTLFLAWYLFPEREGKRYGLESFGEDYGVKKPIILDWNNQTLEQYIHRCEEDVEINYQLWLDQADYLNDLYGSFSNSISFLKYLDFKAYCSHLQEVSGWKVDLDKVHKNLEEVSKEKEDKFLQVKAVMPPVPQYSVKKKPKVMYKKNGDLSSLGEAWIERLRENGLPDDYDGEIKEITGYEEPNPSSFPQLKDWLYGLGWEPETFKANRNKTTGEVKLIPQINLPPNKGGGLCPSVKRLYEKEPNLELLDGYFVLQHRMSVFRGFLRDEVDGRLTARIAGLTNTLRFKHEELVNLPGVDKLYGKEIRSSLIADKGYLLCGSDMSSLEDRLKQHYLYPYDPEYVQNLQTEGYDPHLALAVLAGAITEDDAEQYKNGTDEDKKRIKPKRNIYKNGNYACQYGAGVATLARTCAVDEETARGIHEAYWKMNWSIKACAEDQTVKTVRDQMWLYNPISGFWYSLRFKKDIFSTLVQGSGVFCFDLWLMYIVRERPQMTGQFHDEVILEIKEGFEEPARDLLTRAINQVNEFLQLNVELKVDIQFGADYAQIH